MRQVCVDAGLLVKVVVQEPDSERADALFAAWKAEDRQMIAPPFFAAEVDSVLRQKVMLRHELTEELADACFAAASQVPVETLTVPGQRERAWALARDLGMPHVYDATYLALAELAGCEFWTADAALYRLVKDKLPYVRLLSEHGPVVGD